MNKSTAPATKSCMPAGSGAQQPVNYLVNQMETHYLQCTSSHDKKTLVQVYAAVDGICGNGQTRQQQNALSEELFAHIDLIMAQSFKQLSASDKERLLHLFSQINGVFDGMMSNGISDGML
ncbi:MAG: hypothetical protein ACI8WB_004701 [Phenylobacterium sp.]|jgi:hypothetical protein